jgi:hypothetical protein
MLSRVPLLCMARERQHVPVAEYAQNLAAMVGMARAAGISRIVLLTGPPVGDEARVRHQQKVNSR